MRRWTETSALSQTNNIWSGRITKKARGLLSRRRKSQGHEAIIVHEVNSCRDRTQNNDRRKEVRSGEINIKDQWQWRKIVILFVSTRNEEEVSGPGDETCQYVYSLRSSSPLHVQDSHRILGGILHRQMAVYTRHRWSTVDRWIN